MAHQIDPGKQTVVERAGILEQGDSILVKHKLPTVKIGTPWERPYRPSLESIRCFFRPGPVEEATFENRQPFGFEGLGRRLLSSSYVPDEGGAEAPGADGSREAPLRRTT